MARAGRKRKIGKNRTVTGRIITPKERDVAIGSPTAMRRARDNFGAVTEETLAASTNALYGHALGLWFTRGVLDRRQYHTAVKMAGVYEDFDRLHQVKRSAASPSYLTGRGGSSDVAEERMTAEEVEEATARWVRARDRWADLQEEMKRSPRRKWGVLVSLVVDGCDVKGEFAGEIRWMLNRLAEFWKVDIEIEGRKAA